MKKILFILFIILTSCSSPKNRTEHLIEQDTDTIGVEESRDEDMFKYTYKKLLDSYNNILNIDSTYIIDKDTFNVHLTYNCLSDSLIIPKSFYDPDLKEDLITHNFIIKLRIIKNNVLFMCKSITKENFINTLDGDVKKYAILLYPYIRKKSDKILVSVSISIPLTDIGVSRTDTLSLYGSVPESVIYK